jgi:hypothetical protein
VLLLVQDKLEVSVIEPGLTAMTEDLHGSISVPVRQVVDSLQVSRWTGEEQAGYVYEVRNNCC